MKNITEAYLREQKACLKSYGWLRKQKNKNWKAIANKLYDEKKYDWCLWLLYRKVTSLKTIMWFLIFASYLLSGISIYTLINADGAAGATIVAGAAVAAGAAGAAGATIVAGAAVAAGAAGAAVVAGVAVAAVAAGVAGVAVATVAAGAIVVAVVARTTDKLICKIILKR